MDESGAAVGVQKPLTMVILQYVGSTSPDHCAALDSDLVKTTNPFACRHPRVCVLCIIIAPAPDRRMDNL